MSDTSPASSIAAALHDILLAVEEGCFAVETPRGYAEQSDLKRFCVSKVSDWGTILRIEVEARPETEAVEYAVSELMDEPVVVYGKRSLWRLESTIDSESEYAVSHDGFRVCTQSDWEYVYHAGDRHGT